MPSSDRKRTYKGREERKKDERGVNPETRKSAQDLKDDIDKLLDEIDEILEEDSEEFIENYIQRGGE